MSQEFYSNDHRELDVAIEQLAIAANIHYNADRAFKQACAGENARGLSVAVESLFASAKMPGKVAPSIEGLAEAARSAQNVLSQIGRNIIRLIERLIERFTRVGPQLEDYAKKIDKAEARIDWGRPARELDCLVRGLSPAPGAWCEIKGERIKVLFAEPVVGKGAPGEVLSGLTIACGEGALKLLKVQRAGRGPVDAGAFLRGFPLAPGERLM